jgi:hypothetical protein
MSLHFAETGYVQGMAALAVTLLAYYDEEKAFVMLVRMWELRGLGELYKSGFGGLMAALNEFERGWLGQGEVARKLVRMRSSFHLAFAALFFGANGWRSTRLPRLPTTTCVLPCLAFNVLFMLKLSRLLAT